MDTPERSRYRRLMRFLSRRGRLRILAASLLLLSPRVSAAVVPLVIDGSGVYPMAGRLELLRDPGGGLDAASAEAQRARFVPVDGVANLGVTDDAVWLRLTLRNSTAVRRRVYLVFQYPVTDSVALFVVRGDGRVESLQAGDAVPSSAAVVPSRHFTFPVDLDAGEDAVCLLRVRSAASLSLPLRVVEERTLAVMGQRDSLLYGLVFGGMVLVVLYLLATQRRERWLLWFCVYILAFGLHVAVRGGYVLLALGREGWRFTNLIQVAVIGLLFFSGAAFYRSFLALGDRSRALDGVMAALQYLSLALMPLFLFPNPALIPLSAAVYLVGPLFSASLAVILWLRRVPNAGLFAAGWAVAHLVSVMDFLRIYAVLPYTAAGEWMLPASLGMALLCLSWAVMRRGARDAALARTDGLTGLANRRCFDETLQAEWNRARRQGTPLALFMVDIDDFKRYNDAEGHRAGDRCLQAVAAVFQSHARRAGDLAARYGGEEFVLVLPNTPAPDAARLAESLRAAVEARRCGVTVSVGAASRVPGEDERAESLLGEADRALYRAKETGKNRVVVSKGGAPSVRDQEAMG